MTTQSTRMSRWCGRTRIVSGAIEASWIGGVVGTDPSGVRAFFGDSPSALTPQSRSGSTSFRICLPVNLDQLSCYPRQTQSHHAVTEVHLPDSHRRHSWFEFA